MNIRIDRETGSIVAEFFVIQPGLRRGVLRHIQPETYRKQDGGVIHVAEGRFDDHIIGVFACDREGGIEVYRLLAYQRGDSWDNWTPEGEEDRRRTYRAILVESGVGNGEAMAWGHAAIVYVNRNLTYDLEVVHRPNHGASAP